MEPSDTSQMNPRTSSTCNEPAARLHGFHLGAHVLFEIGERAERERRRVPRLPRELTGELVVDDRAESAFGVGDDEHRTGAEQALRQHERSQDIVGHHRAGVAQHVRIAFLETERRQRVDPGVHTREDRHVALSGLRGQAPRA